MSYCLVEGPRWADTEFYGSWLLAIAKADSLWKEAIEDPSFMKQVDRLMTIGPGSCSRTRCVAAPKVSRRLLLRDRWRLCRQPSESAIEAEKPNLVGSLAQPKGDRHEPRQSIGKSTVPFQCRGIWS
jgi:hypothetical protein